MRNDFEIPSNFFSDGTYRMEKDIDYSKMIETILHEQAINQIYRDEYEPFSDHNWQYDIKKVYKNYFDAKNNKKTQQRPVKRVEPETRKVMEADDDVSPILAEMINGQ